MCVRLLNMLPRPVRKISISIQDPIRQETWQYAADNDSPRWRMLPEELLSNFGEAGIYNPSPRWSLKRNIDLLQGLMSPLILEASSKNLPALYPNVQHRDITLLVPVSCCVVLWALKSSLLALLQGPHIISSLAYVPRWGNKASQPFPLLLAYRKPSLAPKQHTPLCWSE